MSSGLSRSSAGSGGVLGVSLAGIELGSPLVLAAGTCGLLDELADVMPLSLAGGVGALVTKSVTPEPRDGNHTWRIIEHRAGMLNAIGLANPGIDGWMVEVGPRIAGFTSRTGTRVLGSVAAFSIEGYVRVAGALATAPGLAGIELNVSCPNVHGGTEFGVDAGALRELALAVRGAAPGLPLLVKLSPVVAGPPGGTIADLARAAIGDKPSGPGVNPRGADGLCLANTVPAMAIDVHTRRPRLANVTGGLSGPGVHPIAVRLVHEVYRKVAREAGVPIVGIGGVMRWEDAAEFILAGATAVELGTVLFADPRAPRAMARGLERWVRRQGAGRVGELVGAVDLTPPGGPP